MPQRVTPCGWEPELTTCRSGPCCPDVSAPENAAIAEAATNVAIGILWALTGRRFGCCEITVRPCKPETCKPSTVLDLIYWDQRILQNGNLGVSHSIPSLIGGQMYNISCGCPSGCCKCKSDCEVRLPGPVCEIVSVDIDGTTVDPMYYKLYDNSKLVFQAVDDESHCPPCQNYNLELGEEGTWSVTYTIGTPVPPELNFAAGILACEIAKSMAGVDCALPSRVQHVTRQGVDIDYFDPVAFANAGLTGIPIVDTIIRALNPNRLAQISTVWYPGSHNTRRET